MKKLLFFIIIIFILVNITIFAQEKEDEKPPLHSHDFYNMDPYGSAANYRLRLARSSTDYLVTPGDIYSLTYTVSNNVISYELTVDTSYRIRVVNLMVIDARGKTFPQIKTEIENIVTRNYPLSGAQLTLTMPAVFKVFVTGEVKQIEEVPAWGLSRLSSLISDNLKEHASTRYISIKSGNQTRTYDIYRAKYLNDLTQDPFLRPGDTIIFNRVNRSVSIVGEVNRPGKYELHENENIKELIQLYANGFTPNSALEKIEVVRTTNNTGSVGGLFTLTDDEFEENFELKHNDSVIIYATNFKNILYVEGAVEIPEGHSEHTVYSVYHAISNRLILHFEEGETYYALVRKNENWFSNISDLHNAYVLRDSKKIPIDINSILYNSSYVDNTLIQSEDTLIIPFRQFYITVGGAVNKPGRYQYVPDRDWEYYIALAGGFERARNIFSTIKIVDNTGNKLRKNNLVSPDSFITAKTDNPFFYLNQALPAIGTTLSILTFILVMQNN